MFSKNSIFIFNDIGLLGQIIPFPPNQTKNQTKPFKGENAKLTN